MTSCPGEYVTRTHLRTTRCSDRAVGPHGGTVLTSLAAAVAALALACGAPQKTASLPPPAPLAPRPAPVPPPVDAAHELSLGREALRGGDRTAAREHLSAAVDADPSSAEARLDLAELLVNDGSGLDQAGDLLRQAQYLHSEPARFARLCGAVAELRGDDAGAAEAYRTALEVAPDPELRLRRGLLLARLGRPSEAESELSRVVEERPGERAARSALADVYERSGRRDAAEHELAVMAALAPSEPAPVRDLVAFYRRHGEVAKASAAEQRARSLEGEGRKLRPLLPARK